MATVQSRVVGACKLFVFFMMTGLIAEVLLLLLLFIVMYNRVNITASELQWLVHFRISN